MDELTVREAIVADAGAIADIHVGTWQYAYRGLMPNELLDGLSVSDRTAWWTRILTNPMPRTGVFVAEAGGAVVGFCSFGPSNDDDARLDIGEVYAIYVRPDSMGKGVGSSLMSAAHQRLQELGFTEATLWVLSENTQSRAFYAHRGWQPDEVEKSEQWCNFTLQEVRYSISLRPI